MIKRIEFTDLASADAWILQNGLRRTRQPAPRYGVCYLTDSSGEIVGEWYRLRPLDRVLRGANVVEMAWFDDEVVRVPRAFVN